MKTETELHFVATNDALVCVLVNLDPSASAILGGFAGRFGRGERMTQAAVG